MDLPPRAQTIIAALWAQHRDLASGSTDDQRALTKLIAEQIAFECGPQWGVKSASKDRPQGPSEIAFNQPPLYVWRWSDGDGSVTGVIGGPLPSPLLMPLTQTQGQYFISVDPVDHLHVSDTRPPPRDPPPPAIDLAALLDRIEHLEAQAAGFDRISNITTVLLQQQNALAGEVAVLKTRRYVAKLWNTITIVSTPEP